MQKLDGSNLLPWLVAFSMVVSQCGCATASAPHHLRQDREVTSQQVVEAHSDGKIRPMSSTWQDGTFRTRLRQERICQRFRKEQVIYQDIQGAETDKVLLDVIGGIAILGAGAIATFVVAPTQSDEVTEDMKAENKLSDRGNAQMYGAIGGIWGAATLFHGLYIAGKAAEEPEGPASKRTEQFPLEEPRMCGYAAPSGGVIVASFGSEKVGEFASPGDEIVFSPGQNASTLCTEERHLGTPLELAFRPEAGSAEVPLSSFDADACIRAQAAARRLEQADQQIARASNPMELRGTAETLSQAAVLIAALPPGDPDAAELAAHLVRSQAGAEAGAHRLIEGALRTYEQKLTAEGSRTAIPFAATALSLAGNIPERQAEVRSKVYGSFAQFVVRRSAAGLDDIAGLLQADQPAAACLRDAAACPPVMDRTGLLAQFLPASEVLRASATAAAQRTEKTRRSLDKAFSEKVYLALVGAMDQDAGIAKQCSSENLEFLAPAECQSFGASRVAAGQSLGEAQDRYRRLLAKRKEAAWKKTFARCQRLTQAQEAFARVYSCEGACRQVLARVTAETEQLGAMEFDTEGLDADTIGDLRQQCEAAGCPSCP